MKKLTIAILCVLLLLSACSANTPTTQHVIFDADQADSQVDCVVPNKKVAKAIAEAVFEEIPVSAYAETFEIQKVAFDETNDTWIVYFGQDIPLKNIITGGPLTAGYDIYVVIQKKDGAVLKIGIC